jgi:hypothetical protein
MGQPSVAILGLEALLLKDITRALLRPGYDRP